MIPDRWYPIFPSRQLRRRPRRVRRMGRDLVLWRDAEGRAVAMSNTCPHRGAGLHRGRVIDGQLECPWHGFRYDAHGECRQIPCNPPGTRIARGMRAPALPVREARGLVWLWWGEATRVGDELPWFDELPDSLRGSWDTHYELPYHYTRMVETNFDLHHFPFVHRSISPGIGPIVDPFHAELDGDRIRTEGWMRRADQAAGEGWHFRADGLVPNLNLLTLGERLKLFVASTPVDDDHTWIFARYYSAYARPVDWLVAWFAIASEILLVQRFQDWPVFATLPPGSIDDVDYRFVQADHGIALYRRRRAELLRTGSRRDEPASEPRVAG